VHGYTEVNAGRVWEVIARNLGPLDEIAREELVRLRHEIDRGRGLDIGF
jgi:uncharacterized protein with HEPN domain